MSGIINTTINGVQVTLQPAVPVSQGPSGQAAQFQSTEGSGFQTPIIVSFSQPVTEFAIEVVGPSFSGNEIIAFDVDGIEISRTPVLPLYDTNVSPDGSSRILVTSTLDRPIFRITLVPDPNDYVAYRNISVIPVGPLVQPPPQLPIQPINPPVQGFWYEERFVGSPSNASEGNTGVSQDKLRAILSSSPVSTRNIERIQYVNDTETLAPPMTVRWTRTDDLQAGDLVFSGQSDDGILIRVNGSLVVDEFRDQPPTSFSGRVTVPSGRHNIEVIYYNDRGLGVAVVNYSAEPPNVQAPPPLPNPTPQPLPPLPPVPPEVRLEEIIQFTELTISREYIKDSLTEIRPQTVFVRNISDTYDVWLEVASGEGVSVSPQSFIIEKNNIKEIQIAFDVQRLNNYPEGVTRITLPIRLTSRALIVTPEYVVPPPTPPVSVPLPPPPTQVVEVPPPTPRDPRPVVFAPTPLGGQGLIETDLSDTGRDPRIFTGDQTLNPT